MREAQTFCIFELTGIVVVCEDEDLVFTIFQVVTLSFKGFYNSQVLLIISLVSSLGGYHISKEKDYRMQLTSFGYRKTCIFMDQMIE